MPRSIASRSSRHESPRTARTIRFPDGLRAHIAVDSERCGRSFEAQVLAILRRHYGEDVDIAPHPKAILDMAIGSLAGIPERDRRALLMRLGEEDDE